MMKRVQLNNERSDWSDVLPLKCPRFGISKETSIEDIPQVFQNFKISFSFYNQKFTTSWTSLKKNNKNLKLIQFIFYYSSNEILEVKTKAIYTSSDVNKIKLKYSWIEKMEQDTNLSFQFLYLISEILAIVSIIFIINKS